MIRCLILVIIFLIGNYQIYDFDVIRLVMISKYVIFLFM